MLKRFLLEIYLVMINLYERVNKVLEIQSLSIRDNVKNINLHTSKDEPCQIFINVVSGKSNFEPHMHTKVKGSSI